MHVYLPTKSNGVTRNQKVVACAAAMMKNPSVRTATVALRGEVHSLSVAALNLCVSGQKPSMARWRAQMRLSR